MAIRFTETKQIKADIKQIIQSTNRQGVKMTSKHQTQKQTAFIITALITLLVIGIPSVTIAGKNKAHGSYHHELSAKDFKQLHVETVNGSIDINGYDGEQIIIEAEFTVTGKKQKTCDELITEFEVEIKEKGDDLYIEADTPSKFGYSMQVSFDLKVPSRFKVECESTNGAISVNDIESGVKLETTNGAVECNNISGKIEVSAVNGSVTLDNVNGDTEVSTVNGAIECSFNQTPPDKIEIETVNGQIEVNFSFRPNAKIEAETVNGSLKIAGEKIKKTGLIGKSYTGEYGDGKGIYSFETVNGSVKVKMPKD